MNRFERCEERATKRFSEWQAQFETEAAKLSRQGAIDLGVKELVTAMKARVHYYPLTQDEKNYFWWFYEKLVTKEVHKITRTRKLRVSWSDPHEPGEYVFWL